MLDPLIITPTSGHGIAPKSGPLISHDPNTPAMAPGGETFESILAGDRKSTDAADDITLMIDATDADPVADNQDADEPGDQDQATALPDTDAPDEMSDLDDGLISAFDPAEDGRLITGQDDIFSDDPISDDPIEDSKLLHGEAAGITRQALPDRAINNPGSLITGIDNKPEASAPRGLQPINPEISRVTGHSAVSDQQGLMLDSGSKTSAASTTRQPNADELVSQVKTRPAHSVIGLALNQQANAAFTARNAANGNAAGTMQPVAHDPGQAMTEKAAGKIFPLVQGHSNAENPPELSSVSLEKGIRTPKDDDQRAGRSHDSRRGNGFLMPDRGVQLSTVTPNNTASIPVAAGLAPINPGIPDNQSETGRINWITETGELTDTGRLSEPLSQGGKSIDALLRNPELPRHLAAQIASIVGRGNAEKPVEILLNPAELGRVKIRMISHDGIMNVSVIADRQETLDLMRRHIDVLAHEFIDIGYGQADFSFGHNSPGDRDGSDQQTPERSLNMTNLQSGPAPIPEAVPVSRIISDRVDIRL